MTDAAPRIPVCVAGASGRMGWRVVRLLADHPRLSLASALERPGAIAPLAEAPSALVTGDAQKALAAAQVLIDFSAPPAAAHLAPLCAERRVAYVVASTGLGAREQQAIDEAAGSTAVLVAANLSVGVNVMLELVELASARLAGFDVEIGEIHHRHKRDAPSGTALALGAAVERGRGKLQSVFGRSGTGPARADGELGYGALRGGDVAGEHTVYFFGESERVEITHRAQSPDIFARGALVAATWLAGRAPGRYGMRDVLAG